MENDSQKKTNVVSGDDVLNVNPISNPNQIPTDSKGASLNKKKEELFFSSKIENGVSGHLNQVDEKINQFKSENPQRPIETKEIIKQSIVRTLKSDTEKAINLEKISLANIAIAEQKKKQEYIQIEESVDHSNLKKVLFLIVSLVLVLAGISAFYFNNIKEKVVQTKEKPPEITSLIASDHSTEFNLGVSVNRNVLPSLLKVMAEVDSVSNSIENIYITKNIISSDKKVKEFKKMITSEEFLSLIAIKSPNALIRSLTPDYMLGIHSFRENHPFIILKTESYENAFAGMLAWEKNIGKDLEQLFSFNSEITDQDAVNTEQEFTVKKEFEDILIKNKDARVLRGFDGEIILIYSIPNKETILITNSAETLTELFDRVIRSRMIR